MLGIGGHLRHRLHLTEGDVPLLCGVEERVRIRRPGERRKGLHEERHVRQQLLERQRDEIVDLAKAFFDHPLQQPGNIRCGRDHQPTGLRGHHHVRADPMQRTLTGRDLRVRLDVVEPVLEEELLDRRADGLMHREIDMLTYPGEARGPNAGQTRDRRHEATDVEGLTSPRVHRLFGKAGQRQDAAERGRNEIGCLPCRSRTRATERRQ